MRLFQMRPRVLWWSAFGTLVVGALASRVEAHESWPALLEIHELANGRHDLSWRVPLVSGERLPVQLELPENWKTVVGPAERTQGNWVIERRTFVTAAGRIGQEILRFPGLERTINDAHVRLFRLDGTVFSAVVRPTNPTVQLRGARAWYSTAAEYTGLGFHHIMLGVDHLLFVLGLMLIVSSGRRLFKTITAFTLAHSLTLAVATLGLAHAPLEPLNAAIALSILFLGPEVVRVWRGETSLTIRYPWVVAFLFGLLHGFGFASGLSTTGMPRGELPFALLWFNVGVELGQIAFIGICLGMAKAFHVLEMRWPRWVQRAPGYAVGVCGAFWTIQRVMLMVAGR